MEKSCDATCIELCKSTNEEFRKCRCKDTREDARVSMERCSSKTLQFRRGCDEAAQTAAEAKDGSDKDLPSRILAARLFGASLSTASNRTVESLGLLWLLGCGLFRRSRGRSCWSIA